MRTSDLLQVGRTPESLRRSVRRGEIIRIRRGWYCAAEVWESLDDRRRHLVRAAAVVEDVDDALLTGRSAAAVWGIPTLGDLPREVYLLASDRGGGRSEPGVRRTVIGARGAPTTTVHGLPVTTRARTVVDIAASRGFVEGVMAVDWALRSGIRRDELFRVLAERTSSYGSAVARAAIAFGDGAAENGGESAARAVIATLGFATPELQVIVVDRQGVMRPDFRWTLPDGRFVYGEFDGRRKYTRDEYSGGDPANVVWREKKREDRLRLDGSGVVRILWSHVTDPRSMFALLSDARVPRGRIVWPAGPAGASNRVEIQQSAGK